MRPLQRVLAQSSRPKITVPWSNNRYPVSMRNLPPRVRHKAIEIANGLLAAGRPEGQAIRIGIWTARHWAAAHAVRRARRAGGNTGRRR